MHTVSDLFLDDYIAALRRLDFKESAPSYPYVQWSELVTTESTKFEQALIRTIDKYAVYLDPDVLDLLEELINSTFMRTAKNAHYTVTKSQEWGGNLGYYPLIREEGIDEALRDYVHLFSQLADCYNKYSPPEKQIVMKDSLWSEGTLPKIGQDRVPDTPTGGTEHIS